MKPLKYIPLLAAILSHLVMHAQDVITKTDGVRIKARDIRFKNDSVQYRLFNTNPYYEHYVDPTPRIISDHDIKTIEFKNGMTDTFNIKRYRRENDERKRLYTNHYIMYMKGMSDAQNFYEGSYNASTATVAITVLATPVLGLIPAVLCSTRQPKIVNLACPKLPLLTNPDYYQGYTSTAKKIKKRGVWSSYAVGSGVFVVLVGTIELLRHR